MFYERIYSFFSGLIAGEKAVVGATHIIWTPYFTRRIGLPVGGTAFYQQDDAGGVGLVTGIEIVPVGEVSKNGVFSGLLLDVKVGGMLLEVRNGTYAGLYSNKRR